MKKGKEINLILSSFMWTAWTGKEAFAFRIMTQIFQRDLQSIRFKKATPATPTSRNHYCDYYEARDA